MYTVVPQSEVLRGERAVLKLWLRNIRVKGNGIQEVRSLYADIPCTANNVGCLGG